MGGVAAFAGGLAGLRTGNSSGSAPAAPAGEQAAGTSGANATAAAGSKRQRSGEEEEEGDDDDDGDDSGGGGKRIGRKGRPMSKEAMAKSCREKARRERMNESFEELARLCDPSGRMSKSDRVSIVQGALRGGSGGLAGGMRLTGRGWRNV